MDSVQKYWNKEFLVGVDLYFQGVRDEVFLSGYTF